MKDKRKRLSIAKYIFWIYVITNLDKLDINNLSNVFILILFIFLLMINEYIIKIKFESNTLMKEILLICSILGIGILYCVINKTIILYYLFFLLIDIFRLNGRLLKLTLGIHALVYFTVFTVRSGSMSIDEFGTFLIIYLSITGIIYLSRARKKEQDEIRKLNEDLTVANMKLREYSMQVEELTISRERTRVAQELHDSLGHSLMALTMHLEVAKKTFDTSPDKAKEIILKAEEISRDSIKNLRSAVTKLKSNREINNLVNSINELLENFRLLGNVNVSFESDSIVEEANVKIKDCLYKTVQEALTNSIKHGRANDIRIRVNKINNDIKLIVTDNGMGCKNIIESNGLKGISARIEELNGYVNYLSNSGFTLEANIPFEKEVNNDKFDISG